MDRAMVAVIELPDELLNLIYDAAAEEELWPQAMIDIADLTRSLGGFVFGVENKARMVTFTFHGRMSDESHRVYRERHVMNPLAAYMINSPVGKLVRSDDILPLSALQRTAFFDEIFRPQEIAHNAMVPLAAKHDFQVGFNICRSARQGPFEADELRFISRLFPHLRRSLLLGFRLVGYKALQQAQFSVLDRLTVGVILLDRASKVVLANSAARAMTAGDGPLRLRNSVVAGVSQASAQRLGGLIDAALRGAPLGAMSIPHPDDGRLFTILVSSIRSRDIDRFGGLGMRDAAAMVFIFDPARPLDIPAEWIMDAYRLTLAEARVALSVSSGASVAETAHRLNISPNTVKTHLRRVFVKTGASRQSDLARIMASIAVFGRDPSGSA
jgi:DNA-binding CsgD family transcriptional regulator